MPADPLFTKTKLFKTQRELVIEDFEREGKPFVATTKPYKSTKTVVWRFVNEIGGPPANAGFLVLDPGEVAFFDYNIGQPIPDGFGGTFPAPDSWTNLQKASQTNGAERFVIEGISLTYRNPRIAYPTAQIVGFNTTITDPAVKAYLVGLQNSGASPLRAPPQGVDPAALFLSPQLHSPFNLEAAMAQATSKVASLYLRFDQSQQNYIGTNDEFCEGGASSYLRANGDPRPDSRYKIPEGYIWRQSGQPDSSMYITLYIREPVVIPISLVIAPNGTAPMIPSFVALDMTFRMHGLSARPPSQNG